MKDHFALLQLPRRPWLSPDEIQAQFLGLSAPVHPDRVHNLSASEKDSAHQAFAALNSACQALKDPKERLRHLIELERGSALEQLENVAPASTDYYFRIGQLCRGADPIIGAVTQATSPLLRVRHFEESMIWRERLESAQSELSARRAQLDAEIQHLDTLWTQAPPGGQARPLDRLEEIYREYSYVLRWQNQTRERLIRLTLS